MSPKNKIKLNKLRKRVDKVDIHLLKIIKIRSEIVKKVLSLKENKSEIVDQPRIKKILNKIKKESISKKIDPKITKSICKNMIWSFIDYEKRNFKKK